MCNKLSVHILLQEKHLKNTEKQVDPLNSLNLSYKTNELKQIEHIFRKNLLNDLTTYRLKEIIRLQDIIKLNELDYKSKCGTTCSFSKNSLPNDFLRDIFERKLKLKEAVNEQSKLFNELRGMDGDVKQVEKFLS